MQSLYVCVLEQHDLSFVLLAALLCSLGTYATFTIGTHAARAEGTARLVWGATCALALGSAVWTTHFVAMLAYRPVGPVGFAGSLTALSLVLVLITSSVGVWIALRARSAAGGALSGALIGLGVGIMHYTGMAAFSVQGHIEWDAVAVAVSILIGVALGSLSGVLMLAASPWGRLASRIMFVLAVCGLHFTGMSAVSVVPDPSIVVGAGELAPSVLAGIISIVGLGIFALGGVGARLDQMVRRNEQNERRRLHDLADIAVEGLLICHGDRIVAANRSAQDLVGLDNADILKATASSFLPDIDVGSLPEGRELETSCLSATGERVPVRIVCKPIVLSRKSHTIIAIRDQRERLQTEADIRSLALTDPLTGLANRAQFQSALQQYTTSLRARDRAFAVLMLDLDRFKLVNDTLGHAVGDDLLRRVAQRLPIVLRDDDVLARLGGDEFAIIVGDVDTPEAIRTVAARVVDLLGRPFILNGQVIDIGVSVGVAVAPNDGTTSEALMRNADLALYKAKADGRNAYHMFEPELDARMQARRALEQDLRRATARQEFQLHYQPLVDARSGTVSGAEALIRWIHPERGLVSPADFIPLAEETGLIANIGHWALKTACAEAVTWPSHMTVAVNLSPVQFRDPRLADTIEDVLAHSGLPPTRLELEITESVLLNDDGRTLATLTRLKSLGIRISMDDFGTGYSSLSYLRRFPFDKIKIDQSFISQTPGNSESASIVRAIINLGACLGMSTTVEGVETSAQYDFTAAEGCDQIQGYLVSRPLPADQFATFLQARAAA